jgi:glycosyltransferase involved in cell wall biosynthesis
MSSPLRGATGAAPVHGGPAEDGPVRWVVVADSPFLPAQGGGEREHLGFVESAVAAGRVAALVVPTDDDPASQGRTDDLEAIRRLVAPAPVLTVPRRRGAGAFVTRRPYVVASRPTPPGLADQLRQVAPDADAVVVFSYKSAGLGEDLARGLGLPAVLRQHNLEGPYHQALADSARGPRRWVLRWEAWRIDRDERRLERASWLTGIADISAADARVRRSRSRVPVAHVPSFALGTSGATPKPRWRPPAEPVVVFLGALDVATNHDALTWFAGQIWPTVRAAVPGVRWQVVGRKPTPAVRALVAATPGAELHADVADPVAYLRQASLAVNPAVSGSGVNIKLVEYLSVGVPVVSTTRGMAGLGLDPGQDLLVADDPQPFAKAVVDLLASAELAARVGGAGHATAGRLLDVSTSLASLTRLLAPAR